MKNPLRRYALGALAVGTLAGGAAIALPVTTTSAMEWRPATYGLTESADQLLPATISTEQPVRVVTTTVENGKPTIKVTTATSKAAAAKAVQNGQDAANAVGVEVDGKVTALDVPAGSDPYRGQQWDFSKIRVADAWQQSTGAGVTVAVIDSGVDGGHPDLKGNVLTGYDAIANTNGGNTDPNGHGTHVAGTIAAVTGNGAGISAVAPDTKILPIRALGKDGSGYMSDTAEGIVWATDHGASVINMSLGGTDKVTAVSNAITYARSKGVVVVAAAGNSRAKGSPTNYPAADAGVIGVAATDSADKVASYSNAGSYVDVAAPGSNIISTYPTALGNPYAAMNGTSMASPHVAAVAALLKAYRPSLTPDQVQAALQGSAVDLGTAGRDNDYGYGRIDAAAALAAVAGPITTSPTTTAPATTAPTTPATTKPTTPATTAPTANPTPTKTTTSPAPTPSKTTTSPAPTKPVVKVSPVIRVVTSATNVVYGTTSTATYTVTASGQAWANKPVQIGVTTPGSSAFTWTDGTTDATGKVVVTRPATGTFQVKLTVMATDTSVMVTSPASTFVVRAAATVTAAKGSATLALTGAVGQQTQIQRYDRSRWVTVTTFAASHAQIRVTGLTAGAYRFVVPSTTTVTGLTTSSIKVS